MQYSVQFCSTQYGKDSGERTEEVYKNIVRIGKLRTRDDWTSCGHVPANQEGCGGDLIDVFKIMR